MSTTDLTKSAAFTFGRGFIKTCHTVFGAVPLMRDFFPERFAGLFLTPRAGKFVVPTQWKAGIVVNPTEGGIVEKHLFRWGSYETGMQRLIERLVQPGDTFIDVGANVGATTVVAAMCVGPQGRVHAFEPVATTAALLRETIAYNNFKHVTLHEMALGSAPQLAAIFGSLNEVNRGGNSLNPVGHAEAIQTNVQVQRMDEVISAEEWKKATVMKIDVEEFELEVLKGAQGLFDTGHLPAIIVEYARDRNEKAAELFAFLKSLPCARLCKMRYTKRAEGPLVEVHSESELPDFDNLVVLPHSMANRVKVIPR